jgi:hypothetical protein
MLALANFLFNTVMYGETEEGTVTIFHILFALMIGLAMFAMFMAYMSAFSTTTVN